MLDIIFEKVKETPYFPLVEAVWDRRKVAPKSKVLFVLLKDGRLIYFSPSPAGIESWDAFGEGDRFDFEKANAFLKEFQAELRWRRKRVS